MPESLDFPQRTLLSAVYRAFDKAGSWPAVAPLRVDLRTVLRFEDVASTLTPRFIGYGPLSDPNAVCTLRLEALLHIPESGGDRESILQLIRFLVDQYIVERRTELTGGQIAEQAGLSTSALQRATMFVQQEATLTSGGTTSSRGEFLTLVLNPDLLEYENISDLADFVSRRDRLYAARRLPWQPLTAVATASSVGEPIERPDLQPHRGLESAQAGGRRIHCNNCANLTNHRLTRSFQDQDDPAGVSQWHIAQCQGCDTISFHYELYDANDHDAEPIETLTFPPRLIRRTREFPGAPERIDGLYDETIDAFNRGSLLFCAGGLRSLVEAICADQGIIDGPKWSQATRQYQMNRRGERIRVQTLEGRIEGLAEKGILTEAQARRLHEHRFLGNAALHELEIPSSDALVRAIELLEHVMADLYAMPHHVHQLQTHRTSVHPVEASGSSSGGADAR